MDGRSLDLITLCNGWWQLRGNYNKESEEVGLCLVVKNITTGLSTEFRCDGYVVETLIQKAVRWLTEDKIRHQIVAVSGQNITAKCGSFKSGRNKRDYGVMFSSDVNCPDCIAKAGDDTAAVRALEASIAEATAHYAKPRKVKNSKKKTAFEALQAKAVVVQEDDDIW